jgi:hypothetical protein
MTERPELAAWRRRDDLRRGSRTQPISRGDRKAARSTVKQNLRKEYSR